MAATTYMRGWADFEFVFLATKDGTVKKTPLASYSNPRSTGLIAALPITAAYNLGGQRHSRSDGQKFETATPTFNARSSWKYFGLNTGVVADTLLAGNVPVNAQIIGAHVSAH